MFLPFLLSQDVSLLRHPIQIINPSIRDDLLTKYFKLIAIFFVSFHIKKAKKMAFQGRPYVKISSKNKSVYTLSATGYHFTGPIALRPWISPDLRIKFYKYYKAIILFRIKNKE